jgi:hypothetical protein
VSVGALVPQGATIEKVLYGHLLPGEGEQIVVHSSRDISAKGGSASGGGCADRQDYLQVFAFDPAFGQWKPLFEADRWPSPAGPFIPDREDFSNPCQGYESLELVEFADLEPEGGTEELVLALATSATGGSAQTGGRPAAFGGGEDEPGPLFLKVLSFRTGVAEAIYDEATTRGGAARLLPGGRIALGQGTYPSRSSPLWRGRCCPNGALTEVIGWNEEYRQVDVLESSLELYCRRGAVDEVKDDAIIVTCDADGAQRFTGYRLTNETRVLPKEFGGLAALRIGQEVSLSAAEPLELGEEWEVEPVATEIRVLNQRHAGLIDRQAGLTSVEELCRSPFDPSAALPPPPKADPPSAEEASRLGDRANGSTFRSW